MLLVDCPLSLYIYIYYYGGQDESFDFQGYVA